MNSKDYLRKIGHFFKGLRTSAEKAFSLDEGLHEHVKPEQKEPVQKIVFELSAGSVAKSTVVILLLLALGYFVLGIVDVFVLFFVAFLLSAAMEPAIDYLNRKKIPRGLAVLLFYVVLLLIFGYVISYMLPILARQISDLALNLGVYLKDLAQGKVSLPVSPRFKPYIDQFFGSIDLHSVALQVENSLQLIADQLFSIGGNIWEVIKVISHGFINTAVVLAVAYFMTADKHTVDNFIFSLVPMKHEAYLTNKIFLVRKKIGFWIRGLLIMILSMGLLVFVGLSILGVKFAVVLAIIAGSLEIIPVVGPLLAWLLAVPIVLNQAVWLLLPVTILYFVVQQFEGHVLVPIVMERVVGLNPIVIIFALLVGARFLGILGAVLSVPVATTISIFLHDFFRPRRSPHS